METILREKENEIWQFPRISLADSTITKQDSVTVYEDHHGSGVLDNATTFSFTTENEDIWLLPSESYFKIKIVVKKADGTNYRWVARVANAAQNIQAADPDNVNISDNGFNIFSDARLYLGDQEIERIDHLGVATLLTTLLENDKKNEQKNTTHTEINFPLNQPGRQEYLRKVRGEWHLLLPLKKMFSFFQSNNHVFRGTKFRIVLNLNSSDNLILRDAAVAAGKVTINTMTWIVPYVEPSLDVMAKLENQLAVNSAYKLQWKAKTVYKHQPPQHVDVRLPLASSVHKPTRVFVILQHLRQLDNQEHNPLLFQNCQLESAYVEVNSIRFPDKPIESRFDQNDYVEMYRKFLDACEENNTFVDYVGYGNFFPFIHFDISKHPANLYENTNFPTITLYMKFNHALVNEYVAWVIIENEREATLNLENKRMIVVR